MKQLKQMGMNANGLWTFYKTNLKPVLSYACPGRYTILTDKGKTELERLQKTATKIIFSEFDNDFYFLQQRAILIRLFKIRATL